MEDRLSIERDGHVAFVMLDRADKYNALDLRMFEALHEAAVQLHGDSSVRAVVLHGAGENFCAGIDTGVFADSDLDLGQSLMTPLEPSAANLFQRAGYAWRELPVPVICAVRGITYGGGLQIAAGADLRYAAPDSRFSIMETKWGLIPDMALSTTLRHLVAPDRLKELAWSARVFGADEALEYGIVTAIHDDPLEAAKAAAADYAAKSPDAVRGIKRLINSAWEIPEADSLAMEAAIQGSVMGAPNQMEAVAANMQKRPPKFSD